MTQQLPFVSIVMPVHNEAAMIHCCLDSVLEQDYPAILEILVIDGQSTDNTRSIVQQYMVKDTHLRLVENSRKVQTVGLNQGIGLARGEIVIRLDAHAYYATDYVRQCVLALQNTDAACVGGGVKLLEDYGFLPTLFGLVQEHPLGTGVAHFRRTSFEGEVDTVWPGAYWRWVFEKIGPFSEVFSRTEDLDFHARLRHRGYHIWQTPLIRPYYRPRTTFSGLVQQYFGNGEQVIETFIVNRSAISLRHLVPLGWLTSLIVLSLTSLYVPLAGILTGLYVAIYALTSLISGLSIGFRRGLKYALVAPLIFPLIHISYGVGSWFGILRILIGDYPRSSEDQPPRRSV